MPDITNPGSVNVANQGFGTGPVDPNEPVTISPSSNAGDLVAAGKYAPGVGTDTPNQPVTVSPSSNAGPLVDADLYSPESPNCRNTTENTVVNQVYGVGTPANVFV
jgi:hypothetical protein